MRELTTWIIIAIALGIIEALLFHYFKNLNTGFKKAFKFDIHIWFTVLRICLITPLILRVDEMFIFGFICVLIFPFLHDGFYYQVRKWLSNGRIYKKGFIDRSTTTTAKLSMSFFWRLIFFVFGAGMVFVII
jgi:hypothetical protein